MGIRRASFCAVITITTTSIIMLISIVRFGAEPQIPMLISCFLAGLMGMLLGHPWKTVRQGMLDGIGRAMESTVIVLLIGVLISMWIVSGVVPSLIYYGLQLISPKFFLVSAFLISSILSMALGSWGTAGTIGLALVGIARTMGISTAFVAGAVISGAYVGDKWSPISDTNNLVAAVSGVPIFQSIKHMIRVSMPMYVVVAGVYTFMGLYYVDMADPGQLKNIVLAQKVLAEHFRIGLLSFLPLVVLLACLIAKIPAIPGMAIGIVAAGAHAIIWQHQGIKSIFNAAYGGYVSNTGLHLVDSLLTAGGLDAMMFSVGLIMVTMMFGGIMESTGQMEALLYPVLKVIRGFGSLMTVTLATCLGVNVFLPDQYVSIAFPGRMFAGEYDKQKISRVELTMALGVGGISTSALVPWNTCGVFMAGVLGVGVLDYVPYAFFNTFMIFVAILYALAVEWKRHRGTPSLLTKI